MLSKAADFRGIYDWIFTKESILLITHRRPDGDAIGSLVGLLRGLKDNGLICTAYVDEKLPKRYQDIAHSELVIGRPIEFNNYDGVVCLDSANERLLSIPNNLSYSDITLPICNLDHHVDNSRYGDVFFVDHESAATAEVLSRFFHCLSLKVSEESATMFLMGIITDTGGFRFGNTTAETLRIAAWLIENRADYNGIMQKMYFEETAQMLQLQGKLYESMRFAFNNRVAYFFVTPTLLASYNVDEKDTEGLVDLARLIEGVEVACRIQQVEDGIRFSFRSKHEGFPVNVLASELGGGGHKMAAGAFVKNISLEKGEELFLRCAKRIFQW